MPPTMVLIRFAQEVKVGLRPRPPPDAPPRFVALMTRLWETAPTSRPAASEAVRELCSLAGLDDAADASTQLLARTRLKTVRCAVVDERVTI